MKKLGFGCMRLPLVNPEEKEVDIELFKEMIDYFMNHGYTYFDTAHTYLNGNSEKAIREALVYRYDRKEYVIADKLPIFNLEEDADMDKIFDEQLQRLDVDYIDYYMLHNLSSKHKKKYTQIDSIKFIQDKKKEGKVKHIGISTHDSPQFLESILYENPWIEFVQLQINYLDWENEIIQARGCYEVTEKYNKPIIVMEPLKGGALIDIPDEAKSLFYSLNKDKSIASWSFRYLLSLDNVKMILSGMDSMDALEDNVNTFDNYIQLTSKEKEAIDTTIDLINQKNEIQCTGCNYCLDKCPQSIPIPELFKLYNTQKTLNQEHSIAMYYRNFIANGNKKASECIKCSKCINYCPQSIDIPQQLEKVIETFER